MFIAMMYEYGQDDNCVGVDGIITCMGVFVRYNNRLFAVHVPDNTPESKTKGRDAFVKFFKDENAGYAGGANIYAVVRGTARSHAEDEVREYQRLLNAEKTKFIRLNVDMNEGAAIVCERDPHADDIKLKYQKATLAGRVAGSGDERGGCYDDRGFQNKKYATASTGGWTPIARSNAEMKTLKAGSFACAIL